MAEKQEDGIREAKAQLQEACDFVRQASREGRPIHEVEFG
jgi:hypothetical protein